MATAYSPEVAVGTYNRIRLVCTYSGTSASFDVQFRRTSSYTGSWGDTQANITFNGQTKAADYWYSGTVGTDWVTIRSGVSGFTIPTSGGTFNWTFNNPGGSSVLGCSGTITLSAQGSTPSNGYITDIQSYWSQSEQLVVIYTPSAGCSDGGLSLTSLQLKLGITPYTDSGWPDESTHATYNISNGAAKWMSNSAYKAGGTLSIIGNKQYYTGIYAANSAGAYRYKTAAGAPSLVTVPPVCDVWITNVNNTPTTKQIGVWFPNNGGYYTQTFQYRVNGGSWVNGTTKTGTGNETKYVNITGLTPHTACIVETRVTTTAGTTTGPTVCFMTPASGTMNLYGSVSSAATHINKLYCRPGSANWFNKNGTRAAYSACTYAVNGEEITLTGNTNNSGYKWYMVVVKGTDALIGKKITVSFDMCTVGSHTSDIRIFWGNSTDTGYTSLVAGTDNIVTTSGQTEHITKTFTLPSRPSGSGSLLLAFYSNVSSAASAVTKFSNVMVKLGEDSDFIPYNGTPTSINYYDLGGYLVNQTSFTVTTSGACYTVNGSNTGEKRVFIGTATLPAGTYTLKHEWLSGTINCTMYMYQDQTWTRPFTNELSVSSSTPTKTVTFTTTATATYHFAIYTYQDRVADNYTARVSLFKGSTAYDFAAYTNYPGALPVCKLYGSVNGKAKLIFARHTEVPYGRVM